MACHDNQINNLKEKVQCLQQYVPKILKKKADEKDDNKSKRQDFARRILEIVKEISKALIDYQKNKKKFENFKKFTLKSHQRVRIEDLLQIFVDDLDLVKKFLGFVIEEFGNEKWGQHLDQLTQINLYHRMLEYQLYSRQIELKRTSGIVTGFLKAPNDFKNEIIGFIGKHDLKIDKNYILFLF